MEGLSESTLSPYLVTGASRGLGREIALKLAANGLPVIAMARPSMDLNAVGKELLALSPTAEIIACDLSSRDSIASAAEDILERYSSLSGIVHNAGIITPISQMIDSDIETWSRSIQVNLLAVQDLTIRLMPLLLSAVRSRITAISSGAAVNAISGWSAYCTSKAGLEMWVRCLAEEVADSNLSVVAVAPGIVNTEMQTEIRQASKKDFPLVNKFVSFHEEGELVCPMIIAEKLLPIILGERGRNGERLDVRDM
ncbi:MAG TPA: SDR family NAD(P)-dependent oxidoreductase [Candidatus Poseidoniales archaeon]|jgi:NAD(P)-dependent dehydrogenase (short-subunit alcohol dehydrogenase family)|nr:MAG: hypothetical protein CXT69_04140 [Euryarchaeota archaeon]HIG03384.1 SDR family NAD(P)-dependent oxidoreductase [Candidatus Poseidoniales archaeon]HIK78066.1 SDR family NAD(P)-dependent oxidoreductase [Candidatus Poseidoniales archaeon]